MKRVLNFGSINTEHLSLYLLSLLIKLLLTEYKVRTEKQMQKLFLLSLTLLTACVSLPDGIQPVNHFDVNRYVGKWYEIARLDNRFERGLKRISAEYSLREDGGINVVNKGVNIESGNSEFVEGKAYFIGRPDVGSLKVSFFGPFYAGYHIIGLDSEAYRYVMITGSSKDYLWILAREPKLPTATLQRLISQAKQLGFETEQLIYPEH